MVREGGPMEFGGSGLNLRIGESEVCFVPTDKGQYLLREETRRTLGIFTPQPLFPLDGTSYGCAQAGWKWGNVQCVEGEA